MRARPRTPTVSASANLPPYLVDITAVFQLDCMVAGIVPHPLGSSVSGAGGFASDAASVTSHGSSIHKTAAPPSLTAFLLLAYTPPDTSLLLGNEAAEDRAEQARKAAERPELRIVSRAGEELAADALGIANYERWGCNDYVLIEVDAAVGDRYYIVLSPRDIVVVRPRDWRDHVAWLVERQRYEEALEEIERQAAMGVTAGPGQDAVDAVHVGQRYIEHLVSQGMPSRICERLGGC